jgi:hypothetical protein
MKRLLIVLGFVLIAAIATSQTMVAPLYTIDGQGTKGVTNTVAARVTTATSYVYKVNSTAPYIYAYTVRLVDNTGSNTASVVIAASSEGTYWKTLTTVAYTGVGADTAIIGAITHANAVPYNYLRFTITPTDTMWVSQHSLTVKPIK